MPDPDQEKTKPELEFICKPLKCKTKKDCPKLDEAPVKCEKAKCSYKK